MILLYVKVTDSLVRVRVIDLNFFITSNLTASLSERASSKFLNYSARCIAATLPQHLLVPVPWFTIEFQITGSHCRHGGMGRGECWVNQLTRPYNRQ